MKSEGNILVLTQWSFKDALIQTYTLPYVEMIRNIVSKDRKIFLLTAEQSTIALTNDEIDAINKSWTLKNMELLPQPYQRFGIKKMIGLGVNLYKLLVLIKKQKIKTVHAICTPAGGLAYILNKLTGVPFVVDSYEPHAEAMVENGSWKANGVAYKMLFSFERKQTKKALALIGTTAGMKQYALDKFGIQIKNFFIKPACVDLSKFYPKEKNEILLRELGLDNKLVCVYAGKLGGIYYKEEIFNFIKACYERWSDNFRFLMITNAERQEIESECERVKLPGDVVISKFVFHNEVPSYLSLGDFAINPVKPVPTKRFCTSIKDGEYWAMGLPVVISPGISDDSGIIEDEKIGVVVNFADKSQFSSALIKLEELLKSKVDLKKKIRNIGERYRSYILAQSVYKAIYGNSDDQS